jgi:integrase/recombinase XerC
MTAKKIAILKVVVGEVTFRIEPVINEAVQTANQYLEAIHIRGLSSATARAYAYDLLRLFRWLEIKKLEFEKINDLTLLKWIEQQKAEHARPTSINRRLTACNVFYEFCFGQPVPKSRFVPYRRLRIVGRSSKRMQGLPARSDVIECRLSVKNERKLVRPLEIEQVKEFLDNTKRYRDMSIILLMLFCGLRSCEIIALRQSEIDFDRNRLRVVGKGGRERILPFPARIKQVIKRYLRYERPSECTARNLFVALQGKPRGQPMKSAGLRRVFRTRRNLPCLRGANPHAWRHSFGTNMARQGVQLPVLQKMMGHTSFKMTLRYINLAMNDVASEYGKAITHIEKRYL